MNRRAIANALDIGVWSVGQALKKLMKFGFASYRRFSNGTTLWTIRVPESGARRDTTPAETVVVQEAKEVVIPTSDIQPMPKLR